MVEMLKARVRKQRPISNNFRQCDLFTNTGFISIRLTPPMHSKGIRRMTLPADVTVVVQAPFNSDIQQRHFHEIVIQVNTISSGYKEDAIEIPSNCTLAKQMAIRHSREEYLTKLPGIVGINWIPQDDIGVIKLWSTREDALKNAKGIIAGASQDVSHDHNLESVDILWPDPNLAILFERGSGKEQLREFMDSLSPKIQIAYPCHDESVAFKMEGPEVEISSAKMEARIFLENSLCEVSTASVLLDEGQYQCLVKDDQQIMKAIEYACGVRMILDSTADSTKVTERYDLRHQRRDSTDESPPSDDLWVDIMNPTMNTVRIKIIHHTSYTGSSVRITADADEAQTGKRAFDTVIDPVSADICFRIGIPSSAVSTKDKAEWLKWSLRQTFTTIEAYGIVEVAVFIEERDIDTLPAGLVYQTAAEMVVEIASSSRLHSLRHINLCVSNLTNANSESKLLMPIEENVYNVLATRSTSTNLEVHGGPSPAHASSPAVSNTGPREILIRGMETDILLATVELTEKLQ